LTPKKRGPHPASATAERVGEKNLRRLLPLILLVVLFNELGQISQSRESVASLQRAGITQTKFNPRVARIVAADPLRGGRRMGHPRCEFINKNQN
jgi:hypothetical protein